MIERTLQELADWYVEAEQNEPRMRLLSKLTLLELCGWIEGEFDRLARLVAKGRIEDRNWVERNVIARTYGFDYERHWRSMLVTLVGEVFARRIESRHNTDFPGELERIKNMLGMLSKSRNAFAHSDINTNIETQQTFYAPSALIQQHETFARLISSYEKSITDELTGIGISQFVT